MAWYSGNCCTKPFFICFQLFHQSMSKWNPTEHHSTSSVFENVVLIGFYSVVKIGFAYFWAHKSTPSQRFFWKIDNEGVFVLPVDKAKNFFLFSEKWNVLFPCPILIFSAMYAIIFTIVKLMFADTVLPDIIWIMCGRAIAGYLRQASTASHDRGRAYRKIRRRSADRRFSCFQEEREKPFSQKRKKVIHKSYE